MNPVIILLYMYQVYSEHMLGHGSFGSVYLALLPTSQSTTQRELCAVKKEKKSPKSLLGKEYEILRDCSATIDQAGIPKVYSYWSDESYHYMATSLLGPTINALHKMCNKVFSLGTTARIAIQLIKLLQYYHNRGYIHRDIKPSNLLIDYNLPHEQVYLIDFGFAKKYRESDGRHIAMREGVPRVGTLRFMSPYCLRGMEVSCRDDMYSAGYVVAYLFQGELPWRSNDIEHIKRSKRHDYVYNIKKNLTNAQLTSGLVCTTCRHAKRTCSFQKIMQGYFDYIDGLDFAEAICYDNIVSQLEQCCQEHGVSKTSWDWDKYYVTSAL